MVKSNGTIELEKDVKGKRYRVIATEYGEHNSVWSAIDTIRNIDSGKTMRKTRREWKKIFDRYIT